MNQTTYGKAEINFLEKQGFENFVSNCEFAICDADTSRPDLMFCRIGLCLIGEKKQVGVSIEADYRLWKSFWKMPNSTSTENLLRLCRSATIADRQRMVKEMPVIAERHEQAYEIITNAQKDILS